MIKFDIEIFNDVVCSSCYLMSHRLRQVAKAIPELNIIHRSYALFPTTKSLTDKYGSKKNAKAEMLKLWKKASKEDELERFNIDDMEHNDFSLPLSLNSLRAAKAAYYVGGETLYWDVFDALQDAFFIDNKNIEEESVLISVVQDLTLNIELWKEKYYSKEVLRDVKDDFKKAQLYNIKKAPALVFDGKCLTETVLPLPQLLKIINKAIEEKRLELNLAKPFLLEDGLLL